jgi:hypothetical protein
MLKHLFNAWGRPVAYIYEDGVFLYSNDFVGRLDGNEIWHGKYVGKIVNGDRLLYREAVGREARPAGKAVFAPGVPIKPWGLAPCALPAPWLIGGRRSPLGLGYRGLEAPPSAPTLLRRDHHASANDPGRRGRARSRYVCLAGTVGPGGFLTSRRRKV